MHKNGLKKNVLYNKNNNNGITTLVETIYGHPCIKVMSFFSVIVEELFFS